MKNVVLLIVLALFIGIQANAQEKRTISGKVTSVEDGSVVPGATIKVKGTNVGTVADLDGKFQLTLPEGSKILVVSFIGMKTQEIEIGTSSTFSFVMEKEVTKLGEVVVTALGISREKKSLGYSTQEIEGKMMQTVQTDNMLNSLSGKVSGVQIKKTTNMGGSTNIVMRGSKSLTGDNQVLFVVDGVPINNNVGNTSSQKQAGLGYDYGNAASDINPDDIESLNVLKGSAATALYGSRAAGGVIMITTKKGKMEGETKKGIGVTVNSGVTVGFVDKSTFPKYQKDYGAGYGHYYDGNPGDEFWYIRDVNGDGVDEQWVVTSEDASYGAAFNPNLMVYQWDAVDPESPNYMKATPWVAAKNGPITFFEHPVTLNNSVAIENANQFGNYRLTYTNYNQNGLLPNSNLKKDNVLLNGSWKVTDKLTASGSANYVKTKGTGRNSTGYSDNIMTSFRQWYQTNVDVQQQKDAYFDTERNITWNWADPTDPQPIFWDNMYWTRYKNYESDSRTRFLGNIALNYKVTDWLEIMGRASADSYNEIQEERRAIGSIAAPFGIGDGVYADGSHGRSDQGSGYMRRDISFSEYNYDLMANFNKDITPDINIKGVLGSNIRRSFYNRLISSTNGGLKVEDLYSLQNSVEPMPYSRELASAIGVNGIYGSGSFGYKGTYFIDATLRRDHSSTLPVDKSVYYYPSVAGSFIFSNLMKEQKWLTFGKCRINYAQVGNSAGFDQIIDNYGMSTPFYSPVTNVGTSKKNPELMPEKTKSYEGGLAMNFLDSKVGFDLALYNTNSTNQILPLALSTSTGYNSKVINAGEIVNKGIELSLSATPVKTKDFKWTCNVNWSKNWNKVVSLMEGMENLQLGSFQGGITINAMVGQPYGVIYGTDFIYLDGKKVINPANGRYLKTATSDNIIGNMNPDWNGGIQNTFSYKDWSFSFLFDMQKGGDIFSLDMYYGLATGLYEETSYINDLGNPVRNLITYNTPGDPTSGYAPDCGGFINEGVNPDGSVNQTRVSASNYGTFGYARNPDKAFIYDASYVKLREISITYTLPADFFKKGFVRGASFSLVGSNIWILYKNLPHADPESGLGAGNLQGYSVGSLPATRDFGFNLKLTF